jgi:tellurite methyltransferase
MKSIIVDPAQPNECITHFINYMPSGDLLDLGAGPGRHAAFASQHGFNVTAVEPDQELCTVLRQVPDTEVIQSDIASYHPNKDFDVIICAMVLHFLEKEEVEQAIELMHQTTKLGGINVISAYTNQNASDFMANNPYGDHGYLLKPDELRSFYEGWEILEYEEAWTPPGIVNQDDTPKSFHKVNMIARKP